MFICKDNKIRWLRYIGDNGYKSYHWGHIKKIYHIIIISINIIFPLNFNTAEPCNSTQLNAMHCLSDLIQKSLNSLLILKVSYTSYWFEWTFSVEFYIPEYVPRFLGVSGSHACVREHWSQFITVIWLFTSKGLWMSICWDVCVWITLDANQFWPFYFK